MKMKLGALTNKSESDFKNFYLLHYLYEEE